MFGQVCGKTLGTLFQGGKFFKTMRNIAYASGITAFTMLGFDVASLTAGAFNRDSPLYQFNKYLHKSDVYSGFQFFVNMVAVFTGGFAKATKDCIPSESGTDALKFSDMTESEIAKIVEDYRKKAPIEIPDTAKYKAKSMADGYEQISYKWNDGTYKYEVRWHTRTSGAPEGQGNTWVIQRTIPGSGGTKPSTQFLIGENEWVDGWKWYDAINARKNGTATSEQIELLDKGHWKE